MPIFSLVALDPEYEYNLFKCEMVKNGKWRVIDMNKHKTLGGALKSVFRRKK